MNPAIPNALSAPPFKIPDPPEEFGHDGGKFYRAYDALADEIDEDMAKSLKEQLDGMLIFAGLFAGVNSAFLALTLPLLSPDPSGDTNALLAQNNAILMQLAMRANDTVAFNFTLPSAKFSPSGDIFAINTLFSLSLAFAIISSFLAVLGRQWLVYYRRRSGGGPDRQRWEQLKRFLGAQRWRLGLILDDILPSLLQAGLIIFCIAFIFYLRHLNPQISVLIGIPVYLGFAIFIGSALCTLWDTFCPFQSPLSHLLHWSVKKAPSALRIVLGFTKSSFGSLHKYVLQFVTQQVQTIRRSSSMSGETDSSWTNYHTEEMPRRRIFADIASIRRCLRFLARCREEETLESLQVIAIQRAICTSDDPATLLYAIGNILGIGNVAQMEQLWRDPIFQERFFDQFRDSYTRMLQIRGRDQVDVASSARRLYCAAACPQSARSRCRLVGVLRPRSACIRDPGNDSFDSVRGTFGFSNRTPSKYAGLHHFAILYLLSGGPHDQGVLRISRLVLEYP
ncbi:hypothetical protein FRC05_001379 [Tulasnella sp. 425]|nr:hypothetical protein FRC05_001379 [Tulasnella sp. 425]